MLGTDRSVTTRADVLVAGAGPAGLFAALGVLATDSSARVLVIDAGRDIDERRHETHPGSRRDLISGIGGAGLFSDGKLCLDLEVGGALPTSTDRATRRRLLESVAAVFGVRVPTARPHIVDRRTESAGGTGLDLSYYPVVHIGTDHCAAVVRKLRERIRASGGTIMPATRLRHLNGLGGEFAATIESQAGVQDVQANNVVLALGKTGARMQQRLCERLGASIDPVPMYLGLRIEYSQQALAPFFNGLRDPKYKLHLDDGTKVKTHCASDGGFVVPLYYDALPVAGGHAMRDESSGKSSMAILWDGIRGAESYRVARRIMRQTARNSRGRLLVQRLGDYLLHRPSISSVVARSRPSTVRWMAGDVRRVLPESFFGPFELFLCRLAEAYPEILDDDALMFAPAIEWWMNRVETDGNLQTSRTGLYVAGDGGGWSQGIVHSAATGLLAAEGITSRPGVLHTLSGRLSPALA